MERSIFSKQHFRHRKGIPDIPQLTRTKVPDNWAQEVERLEKVFEGINLPLQPFQLNKWTKIYDLRFCIEADLAIAKANIGKRTFLPYLERVQEIETDDAPRGRARSSEG